PDGARSRLRASWAEAFHREVYPLLLELEDPFADLYGSEGRPNWSVARMVGILLLQELENLTDQVALDHLSFDLRWHLALELHPGNAYLSRRSLVEFRSRLVEKDPEGRRLREVFDRIVAAASRALGVSHAQQRLDSTHIVSNIHTRGRRDLFASTLRVFVRVVEQQFAADLARLPASLRAWAETDEDGEFGGTETEGRADLAELAAWLVAARDAFPEGHPVRGTEAWALVARLIGEQIVVLPAGGESAPDGSPVAPVVTVHKPTSPGSALQSPHDPDAGYGHKGCGYETQIVETCNNTDTIELITDFDVHGSGTSDQGQAGKALDRLAERGATPDTLFVDSGYVSMDALADAEARGVDLHGPVNPGPLPNEVVGRDAWIRDPETGLLAVCPTGNPVERHAPRTNPNGEVTRHAFIAGMRCRDCPLSGVCLARPPNNGKSGSWHIEDNPLLNLRDQRLATQKSLPWRRRYRVRAGIESTNSELKRKHGLGRLRVRRAARVRLAVTMKLTACNVKRWLRAGRGR
ncbi:MAG: transposase, partial [Actinomycetota bacterium]